MKENYTILLDMDNVLIDFDRGAAEAHGISIDAVNKERLATCPDTWPLLPSFGYVKGLGRPLTLDEFWEPIHERGEFFWENLDPLPWYESLIKLVETELYWNQRMEDIDVGNRRRDFHIISGPSRLPESYSGKAKWLKNYFGRDFNRFCLTSYKELFARDNRVLIDDSDKNCEAFIEAGGLAILFPALGNRLYHYADNPLPYVQHQLNLL